MSKKSKQKKDRQPHKKRNPSKPNKQKPVTTGSLPNKQNNSSCLYSETERSTRLEQIIAEEWKGNTTPPKGLMNLGNTCFLNAVLQNIARLPVLRDYFLGQPVMNGEHGMTLSMRVFFHAMWLLQDRSVFRPNKLMDHLGKYSARFRSYEQQDAHEALRILVELLLEEATNSVDNSSDCSSNTSASDSHESFMEKVFLGKLQSCVECEQCHSVSTVEEPFLDISLTLEAQDTEETCSVAGGCYTCTNPIDDIPQMDNKETQQIEKTSPPIVDLWEEEDVHQVTLGLDALFEDSNTDCSSYWDSSREPKVIVNGVPSKASYVSSKLLSLEESLKAFLSPEMLQGENAYYCESCNESRNGRNRKLHCKDTFSSSTCIRTKAKKCFQFRKLGQVVILHLKRFRQVGLHFEKVSGNISFPLEWNLSQYTQEDSTENDYFLSGMVVHQGSLEYGHYIAYVRASCSPQQHCWYYCSDEHVTWIENEEEILSSEPYILFYCKKQRQ